ncbi:MAG: hypothetical protein H0W84_13735, partial [Bacteroidetes bacterium]|nr:hypothetical protein [Bacteroidota bacterium]
MKQILLFSVFLFHSCFAFAQTFLPSQASGLSLWLSADSVELTSGKVSGWYDKSVNTITLTQSNSIKQPAYAITNSQMNNHPCITFDGVDDYLKGAFNSTLSNDSITLFFVQKTITASNYSGSLVFVNNTNSTDHNSPDNLIAFLNISGTANAYRFNNSVMYNSSITVNPEIYHITMDGTTLKTYLNNAFAQGLSMGSAVAFDNVIVGSRWDAVSTNPINCDVYEIILYNRLLAPSEQNQVIQYLRYKYAPPVN